MNMTIRGIPPTTSMGEFLCTINCCELLFCNTRMRSWVFIVYASTLRDPLIKGLMTDFLGALTFGSGLDLSDEWHSPDIHSRVCPQPCLSVQTIADRRPMASNMVPAGRNTNLIRHIRFLQIAISSMDSMKLLYRFWRNPPRIPPNKISKSGICNT